MDSSATKALHPQRPGLQPGLLARDRATSSVSSAPSRANHRSADQVRGTERTIRVRIRILLILALGFLSMGLSPAQDRTQARSVVMSRGGIVAAESPLAAQAGAAILANGGNAIDAAIATNAVMGVVAPMMNGIGGDLFAIVYDAKSDKLYGLNASGWAPSGLTIEFLKSHGIAKMPEDGIQTVTVPGVVDG